MKKSIPLTTVALVVAIFNVSSFLVRAQDYTYTATNATVTITGYFGPAGAVTVPSRIDGLPVIGIGDYAFLNRQDVTSVNIGNTITNIGMAPFFECDSLTAITVDALNPCYSSADGVLFDQSRTTLIQYPGGKSGSYAVPHSVTTIGSLAFYSCIRLTSVTIPDGVPNIGYDAFGGCTSLTNVTLPNSVTNIGVAAFAYCSNLTAVYFNGGSPNGDFVALFYGAENATVYYLPGTSGWDSKFAGSPTALWSLPYPLILNDSSDFGVQTNRFGFIISWATNASVVVEASTNLANPIWTPVSTNTLTSGSSYFSDPEWRNYPSRFYRIHSP